MARYEQRTGGEAKVEEGDESAIATALGEALRLIGPGDVQARNYHRLMTGIVEFVFFPQLLHPKKEQEIHEGRKRIDIVMENGAAAGVFYNLHTLRRLPCAYVPIECKNYTTDVANPELDQIAGRFSVNRGKVGFLCCRHFENRELFVQRCRDTFGDDRGLVLPLDDESILRILSFIEDRRRPEIDDFLSDLVREIWVG